MSLIERAVEHLEGLQQQTADTQGPSEQRSLGSNLSPDINGESQVVPPKPEVEVASRKVDLDLVRLGKAGFITPDSPNSLTAEEFRVIKRPLLANFAGNTAAPIRNANLIMVTSALPGEGKSYVATNLAISIAMELDRTVLLVDADVARPSLPQVLGLPEQKGFLDTLQRKDLKMSDVLLRTNIDKLTVLMAGTRDANATELLASEGMRRLLDELASRYSDRIVIFDAPPLLLTTEARVLATQMGQIVFVVRAEETPSNAIMEALATIETCPVKLMVLNQAHSVESVAYGYDYGYGY